MTDDNSQKLDIDWVKTFAGALAAVSSAVLLSTLGAAGTIIGAALGSVIVTVGGAVYTQGLARSRARLAQAQALARQKVGSAQADLRRASGRWADDPAAEAHLAQAEERLDEARDDLDGVAGEPDDGWRERLVRLPWKQVSMLAAGLFAGTVLAITAFELVAGDSVSSLTGGTDEGGGTTISRIGGGDRDDSPVKEPGGEAPSEGDSSEGATPTDEPADDPAEPTGETPTPLPTTVPTPTTEPTAEPTTQPTTEPTTEPSSS